MSVPTRLTRQTILASRPRQPQGHFLDAPGLSGRLVFHTGTSRLEHRADAAAPSVFDPDEPVADRWDGKVRALSLAVAQHCNLGCTYCYAQQGSFGAPAKKMSLETALLAVDTLLADASPGDSATLAFMGGEPMMARDTIRLTVAYAVKLAAERGARMNFSLTTNGTLLTADDAVFFEEHGFAVTVSLDGIGADHDALRPTKNGVGTYERIMERVLPLLNAQRRMQVSARVTVTPQNLELGEMMDEFVRLGFHSVGFSPMLSSPGGGGSMDDAALERMLAEMISCGLRFEQAVTGGERYPFLNMVNAMRELHGRARRNRPCGAAAGYLGVGADGSLAACHRFVGEEAHTFGSLTAGRDTIREEAWLRSREVPEQEPCRSCWARHLCGGGCHYEVIHRGREACDFIRGWLHYCLQAYARLSVASPDWFTS